MNIPYKEYLQSETWKRKREYKLQEAGHKCQLCNDTDRLEVHHRTYDTIFNEPPNDLIVLCNKCHSYFHHVKSAGEDFEESEEEFYQNAMALRRLESEHLNSCFICSDIITILENVNDKPRALEIVDVFFNKLKPELWKY